MGTHPSSIPNLNMLMKYELYVSGHLPSDQDWPQYLPPCWPLHPPHSEKVGR